MVATTVVYQYVYASGKLIRETIDDTSTEGTDVVMDFFYDANGNPYAMDYNGQRLYYILNPQGDVQYLVDSSGSPYVTYTYDEWGNPLLISNDSAVGKNNPLRYRGYVYDSETGFYYLQSRYYDPVVGRFINADSYASTGQGFTGYNMFAYCLNNPVCYVDNSGEFPWMALLGVVACIAAIGVDHYLAKNHPEGLVYKKAHKDDDHIPGVYSTARISFAEGKGFEFDSKNGITICDLECGLIETSYGTDSVRVSGLNGLTAKAAMYLDWSGGLSSEVSGLVSIYSANAECTIPLPGGTVTLSGAFHAGAVGAGYELDTKEWRFAAITPGLIPGLVFEWDVDFDMVS